VGSLVLVDQAESSSERESQRLLASVTQTCEASQEVKVGCRPPAFRTQSVGSKPAPQSDREHFQHAFQGSLATRSCMCMIQEAEEAFRGNGMAMLSGLSLPATLEAGT
jgi:hypothetical protein